MLKSPSSSISGVVTPLPPPSVSLRWLQPTKVAIMRIRQRGKKGGRRPRGRSRWESRRSRTVSKASSPVTCAAPPLGRSWWWGPWIKVSSWLLLSFFPPPPPPPSASPWPPWSPGSPQSQVQTPPASSWSPSTCRRPLLPRRSSTRVRLDRARAKRCSFLLSQ